MSTLNNITEREYLQALVEVANYEASNYNVNDEEYVKLKSIVSIYEKKNSVTKNKKTSKKSSYFDVADAIDEWITYDDHDFDEKYL